MVGADRGDGHALVAVVSALVAPAALIGGWVLGGSAQAAGFDGGRESISALAASATPHRWVMTTGLVLTGIAHVVSAWALPFLTRISRLVLGLGGVLVLGVAAVPLPERTGSSVAHLLLAGLAFSALSTWPWFSPRVAGPWAFRPLVTRAATAVLVFLTLAVAAAILFGFERFGLVERAAAGAQALWPLVVAVAAWWFVGHPLGPARARRALALAAMIPVAALGGAVATVVAPSNAEMTYYRADVSLSPNPFASSALLAETVMGDLRVRFTGLAPGVVVRPEVKETITEAFADGPRPFEALSPSPGEITTASRSALGALAVRYVIGAFVTSVLVGVLAATFIPRWRRPASGHVRLARVAALGAGATMIAALATGVAAHQAYRPQRFIDIRATGLLGLVQTNKNLLGAIEGRAEQVTPYVRNLLTLSSALTAKYAPLAPADAESVRVLLVSDIHDGNSYPLMRTIIEEEGIDLVIDGGDIVTFGHAQELEAANLPEGIEALGVPYLFVRGNHDATSPTDPGVLNRLAQIPNVVLLQPDSTTYQQVSIGGIRIAGFNDPRWFGDSGQRTAQAQRPATEAFVRTFTGRVPLDLVVSHEPAAVRGMELGSILVNGHMHARDLEANRIQVGTFTGGGPFSHYLEAEPGAELVGQPSSFDVLTFGGDCRLATLTRYTFRNVIEGRPAYDDVALVNGRTIVDDPPPAENGRTCAPGIGMEVEEVPVVSPADSPSPSDVPAS